MPLRTLLTDFVFPKRCINCGAYEKSYVCGTCRKFLEKYEPESFVSRLKHQGWDVEERLKHSTKLEKVYYFYKYNDLIHKLILSYKYGFNHDLVNLISELFQQSDEFQKINFSEFDLFTYTPTSKLRLSWRGFNHTKLITEKISNITGVPYCEIFVKIKETKPQIDLSREERLLNLRNSYEIKTTLPVDLNNKKILIIDDVLTTGSTLEECARTLKRKYKCTVSGMCLARGED